jgi:hypothetical protein
MPLLHSSIADIPEKELVERVLRDSHHRHTLFNIKGLDAEGGRISTEIDLRRFRRDLRGDIDILVVQPNAPESATAIEVKRFKLGMRGVRSGQPNGLGEFAKGVRQANRLARLGFSQVYLWVFVVIDTREQNAGRFTYAGPSSLLRSRIQNALSTACLDSCIGLMHFEWVQPMDKPPLALGTHGANLERLAHAVPQAADVTAWMKSL